MVVGNSTVIWGAAVIWIGAIPWLVRNVFITVADALLWMFWAVVREVVIIVTVYCVTKRRRRVLEAVRNKRSTDTLKYLASEARSRVVLLSVVLIFILTCI